MISSLVTTRTDPGSIYRRDTSQEWWRTQAGRHSLYISAEVLIELSDPAFPRRVEALERVAALPVLGINQEVQGLARLLVREKVMPEPVAGDSIHVAVACVHRMEYLLSWNVRHLANPNKLRHLDTICLRLGFIPPRIVTPDLLWDESNEAR